MQPDWPAREAVPVPWARSVSPVHRDRWESAETPAHLATTADKGWRASQAHEARRDPPVPWDLPDRSALTDNPVSSVLPVMLDNLVLLDHQVLLDPKVLSEQRAQKVFAYL